jgi:hypothetical protein
MQRVIIAAIVAALFGSSGLAYADDQGKSTGETIKEDAAKAGEAVKDGAIKAGEAVKRGAQEVGDAVKNGAVDAWEASKAAVGAGSDTFNKRRDERARGGDPDAPH